MEEQTQKSWFRRNWLWFVPSMGCLTLIILGLFGIFSIFSMFTNSTPTTHGLEEASKHPKVIQLLGTPIEDYGIPQGNMSFDSSSGNRVSLVIPIKGPKGKGKLTVKGSEEDGVWVYEKLSVFVEETNERINLLEKSLEGI